MKWIFRFLIAFAALVAVAWIIGMSLPQNHTVSRSARFAAAPETIWATLVDVSSYPEWRSGVDTVILLDGTENRLAWQESMGGDRLSFDADTTQRPKHLQSRITDTGIEFGGSWDYVIEPDGEGTRLTITENGEVYSPLFRFMSRYVMGHGSTIERYLSDLAARLGETSAPVTR